MHKMDTMTQIVMATASAGAPDRDPVAGSAATPRVEAEALRRLIPAPQDEACAATRPGMAPAARVAGAGSLTPVFRTGQL